MAKKREPLLGHVTFRLPEEEHRELLEIARMLGTDLSGLIKQMLAEAKPIFEERAEKVRRKRLAKAAMWWRELVLMSGRMPDPGQVEDLRRAIKATVPPKLSPEVVDWVVAEVLLYFGYRVEEKK
jgi:hypothetical protein